MAPRETLDTAVTPGSSLRVSPLPLGTARPLRKTRTPMRFASAHCTTSGLIPPRHRLKPLQTSDSLKPEVVQCAEANRIGVLVLDRKSTRLNSSHDQI